MGSFKIISVYSQSQLPNPRFSIHSLSFSPKPPLSNNFHHTHKLPKLQFHLAKLHISSKLSLSSVSYVPTSSLSKINKCLIKVLGEKIVVALFGAFIFMGSFGLNARLSLARAAQASDFSANIEEKRDAQMENSQDEEMYEKVLEKEPRNLEALKVVVHAKMRRGQTKQAVKYVERLIDIEPEEVEWRLLEALCYEMMGQLTKAKRLFKEILKKRPLLLRALHGLALVMHKNLEGAAVFEMLNKALEVAYREKRVTEERNIRILIAQMHVVKGELEEGLKKFQDLVNENPRDFRPYLCQGIIYSLLDRKKGAAEQFETYQSLVPEEFPQRRFLDDVILAAKAKPHERFQKEFQDDFSHGK